MASRSFAAEAGTSLVDFVTNFCLLTMYDLVSISAAMTSTLYDPIAQFVRAEEWLVEAERANLVALRDLCLIEGARCHRRAERSLTTPVLHPDRTHKASWSHRAPQLRR